MVKSIYTNYIAIKIPGIKSKMNSPQKIEIK